MRGAQTGWGRGTKFYNTNRWEAHFRDNPPRMASLKASAYAVLVNALARFHRAGCPEPREG